VNEQGKSFLDQFRILVTEIGNALGYVRMVRSASMYYCSEAVKFLPDIDKVISFEVFLSLPPSSPSLTRLPSLRPMLDKAPPLQSPWPMALCPLRRRPLWSGPG
jgi:hypothetical protein